MTESHEMMTNRIQNHQWYGSISAFVFGCLVVVSLALIGGAIGQSTDLINISGEIITVVRMASIGLGTGYYLGSSLKNREAGRSWFLFGAFSTLTVLAVMTVDGLILGQYPFYLLLVITGLTSVFAHMTPFIVNNESYMSLIKFVSGYMSTVAVTLLAISEYLLTMMSTLSSWYEAKGMHEQIGIIVLFIAMLFCMTWIISALVEAMLEEDDVNR
jgi:sensor histidine kinase YesM